MIRGEVKIKLQKFKFQEMGNFLNTMVLYPYIDSAYNSTSFHRFIQPSLHKCSYGRQSSQSTNQLNHSTSILFTDCAPLVLGCNFLFIPGALLRAFYSAPLVLNNLFFLCFMLSLSEPQRSEISIAPGNAFECSKHVTINYYLFSIFALKPGHCH